MGRLSKSLRNEKMQAYVRQADKTLLDLQPPGRALTYLLPQPEEPAPSPGCSHPVPQLPWVSTPAEGPGGSMLAPAPGSEGSHQSGRAAARLGTVVQVNAPSTAPVGMPAPPSAAQIQPASDPCHVMRVQGCGSLFTPQHPRGSLTATLVVLLTWGLVPLPLVPSRTGRCCIPKGHHILLKASTGLCCAPSPTEKLQCPHRGGFTSATESIAASAAPRGAQHEERGTGGGEIPHKAKLKSSIRADMLLGHGKGPEAAFEQRNKAEP
ncbi:hypothetical protein Anapl_11564 [Anas platyrhynchos]|uniref:Uncharacterized protein n=1 Tax=Anas platyrhynchos TaxID=8839 RepID=R0JVX1_ANAPL|nr:hypothetical protein Anapl_11564 [Anas platyrhynchos]